MMEIALLATIPAAASAAAWIVLIFGRGFFWKVEPRLPPSAALGHWPSVVTVIPARNEAALLPETLPSLLGQDYPGELRIIVVDDHSDDGTAEVARRLADETTCEDRLEVLAGSALKAGWVSKPWAVHQGIDQSSSSAPDYILLTDADIRHPIGSIAALVSWAERNDLDLVSVMARLWIGSFWDRLLIPAFVYFFAKLFPFHWVGDPRRKTAAGAGGCILVRSSALERAGGISSIAGAIIDDVALGTRIKKSGREGGGRIWLGYHPGIESRRAHDGLAGIWSMVARTAFTQLGGSYLLLTGTLLGMILVYVTPPAALAVGISNLGISPWAPFALSLGGVTWAAMAASYVPMLRSYRVSPWFAPLLPLTAALYTAMTLDSGRRTWLGRGGAWKGRTY